MKFNSKDYWIIGLITLVIFLIAYSFLSFFNLLPSQFRYVDINEPTNGEDLNDNSEKEILYPDKIIISKIGVESVVKKPESQDVAILNQALKEGAVYYPGSGTINVGNMFIFGHSADRFTGVTNPAYKVFNNISKLKKGDEIKIESNGRTFVYKVENLNLVDENTAWVDFGKTDRMLTISTCNTFGQKEDRWVVEAKFEKELDI